MINEAPLARFAPLAGGLLKPIYADYSFANIANTIEHLLTGDLRGPLLPPDCFGGAYPRPRKVVTFFVDSFGWAFWKAHGDRFRTTRAVMEKGVVTPISALFPSTTAASVSTLNLGVPPSAHALYEWNIYIPAYGEVIQSLAFAPLGRHGQDACVKKGYDPAKMLEVHETVHQRLARHGVRSVQFSNRSYAGSAYNSVASAGADVVRHGTLSEALVQLKEMLRADAGQGLARLLLGLDRHHRPHPRARNEPSTPPRSRASGAPSTPSSATSTAPTRSICSSPITARSMPTSATRSTSTSAFRRLADCLPVSPTGNPIYPNGSPRDVFLHVRPERRDDVLATLQQGLDGIALVMPMDEALDQGLFGPGPISPGAAPQAGRHSHPSLSRPFRLVARAGCHGEHVQRPSRRPCARRTHHRFWRDRHAVEPAAARRS